MKSKCAIVLGGSRGLGFGIATALVKQDWQLLLVARSLPSLVEAQQQLQTIADTVGNCDSIRILPGDIVDPELPEVSYKETLRVFGRIDALVLNHGGPAAGALHELTDDQWHSGFELLIGSTVRWTRKFVPVFSETGGGNIVIVASSSMREPIAGLALSNVFRAGLMGFVKTAAREWAAKNVAINAVAPGMYETDRLHHLFMVRANRNGSTYEHERTLALQKIPAERFGEPEELGRLAAFLCSSENRYITGQTVLVDGGAVVGIP
ncbi:MAG: SDR family oxidoreductase [bacterium]|nr:SDR family oxidoreductase [bacterium]